MKKEVKSIFLYPPEQNWPDTMCKPNGSLAYPYLAGSVLRYGSEATIYDACVGNDSDDLWDIFDNPKELESGMLKTGVSDERILSVVEDYDIVGLTSIFSHQETMVLTTAALIKSHFPEKIIVSGGVNARNRTKKFFDAGISIICASESERTIIEIVRVLENKSLDFSEIPNIYIRKEGKEIFTGNKPIIRKGKVANDIIWDLDELPLPAWDLLPNKRYWEVGRPHGGHFKEGEVLRYASMMTSRGCPFRCAYCHISGEVHDSPSGSIGNYRIKSDDRVMQELEMLKDLGVKQVFIEDDSLLAIKPRAKRLLKKIKSLGLQILDVNGVNILHLLRWDKGNKGEVDFEILESLQEAGFREIGLPFESANSRIIKKYASSKWDIERSNIPSLLKSLQDMEFRVPGMFMLGYPDESREEIMTTVNYAYDLIEKGLSSASFFLVMPLPGTKLFDDAIANGNLPKDFSPDKMHWQKANMVNTEVPPEELEHIRNEAWETANGADFVKYKQKMRVVDKHSGEIHEREEEN